MILAPARASRSERANRSSSTGAKCRHARRPAPRASRAAARGRVRQVGQLPVGGQGRHPDGLAGRWPAKASRAPPKIRRREQGGDEQRAVGPLTSRSPGPALPELVDHRRQPADQERQPPDPGHGHQLHQRQVGVLRVGGAAGGAERVADGAQQLGGRDRRREDQRAGPTPRDRGASRRSTANGTAPPSPSPATKR